MASEPPEETSDTAPRPGARLRVHVALFLVTVLSVFHAGAGYAAGKEMEAAQSLGEVVRLLPRGWTFAVPMMAILLCHEFGHYIAARIHKVPASLPYFIPLPLVGLFGTMGAVISMPERIRSRNALLDIGAAGPLAGLVVAIPVLAIGLAHSPVHAAGGGMQEGQSLLYLALKRIVLGPIPAKHDVFLHPTALAGWAGLLITVLNLLPIGQLDGGHISYALFDTEQNRLARILHRALPLVFVYNLIAYKSAEPGLLWLVWFALLALLARLTGGNHPPTEPGELSRGRRGVAVLCLVLFALLFMPTPMRQGDLIELRQLLPANFAFSAPSTLGGT
jgi:membrane-associated protease RseP (regulator of RpoE activity)